MAVLGLMALRPWSLSAVGVGATPGELEGGLQGADLSASPASRPRRGASGASRASTSGREPWAVLGATSSAKSRASLPIRPASADALVGERAVGCSSPPILPEPMTTRVAFLRFWFDAEMPMVAMTPIEPPARRGQHDGVAGRQRPPSISRRRSRSGFAEAFAIARSWRGSLSTSAKSPRRRDPAAPRRRRWLVEPARGLEQSSGSEPPPALRCSGAGLSISSTGRCPGGRIRRASPGKNSRGPRDAAIRRRSGQGSLMRCLPGGAGGWRGRAGAGARGGRWGGGAEQVARGSLMSASSSGPSRPSRRRSPRRALGPSEAIGLPLGLGLGAWGSGVVWWWWLWGEATVQPRRWRGPTSR